MKRLVLFFLVFVSRSICAYSDPEIEDLLSSLSNPFNPTFEDYRLIEHYFQYGERPYLETMKKVTHISDDTLDFRIKQLRNCMLVGPNEEMPIFELYASHVTQETEDRCILIYATYNPHYPGRALRLFEELKECGYSGYIMLRVGGIPDISYGGARLCTTPYTWRINFFKEAVRRGFTKILYLDASLHPLGDLSAAFDLIDSTGFFSCSTGPWPWDDYIEYIQHVGIPIEQRQEIPWLYGHFTGLNFTNEKICQLFEKWDEAIHRMDGFCSMGDDVLFTCLAWNFGFSSSCPMDEIIGFYDFPPFIGSFPPSLILYQDDHRYLIRGGLGPVYD